MPETGSERASETAAFDALALEFFSVWFRFHPGEALAAGQQELGKLLPAQSDDDHAALGSWLETLIVALEEIDYQALDHPRRLDLELMFALARVEHREMLERDWRHRDPLRFLPLNEIHRLTLLRPPGMRDSLSALLTAIPDHLRLALAQLQPMAELVPPVLVAAAIAAADDGRRYLRTLSRSRWLRAHCHGCGELETQAEAAGEALAQYASALLREIAPRAAGDAGCGEDHLRFLLRHRHQLEVEPIACAPLLEALAAECDRAFEAAMAGVTDAAADAEPGEPANNRPSTLSDRLRTECRDLSARLRHLDLLTLPRAPLRIAGGPASPQAHQTPIEYLADLSKGEGILFVPDGANDRDTPVSGAELRLLCLRLGWGGAHALAFCGGMAARALPRRLSTSTSLTGGWPLHLEALLFDGPDAEPDERLAALQRRRLAIALARLDLALHCGTIDADQALSRLLRIKPDQRHAADRLAQIARSPGDALAAVLGWRLIDAAAAADGQPPRGASRRLLHDQLLRLGAVPLSLVLRQALGDGAWDGILTAVLQTRRDAPRRTPLSAG
jgi:hypothetical protein